MKVIKQLLTHYTIHKFIENNKIFIVETRLKNKKKAKFVHRAYFKRQPIFSLITRFASAILEYNNSLLFFNSIGAQSNSGNKIAYFFYQWVITNSTLNIQLFSTQIIYKMLKNIFLVPLMLARFNILGCQKLN